MEDYEKTTNPTIIEASLRQGLSIIREIPRSMRVRVENLVSERFSQIENDVRFRLGMDNIVDQLQREASEAFASVARSTTTSLSALDTQRTAAPSLTPRDPLMNGSRQVGNSIAAATDATGIANGNPFRREMVPPQQTSPMLQRPAGILNDEPWSQPHVMAVPSPFNRQPVASERDRIPARANPFGGFSTNTPMQAEISDAAQEFLGFGGGTNSESYFVDQDIFFSRRH